MVRARVPKRSVRRTDLRRPRGNLAVRAKLTAAISVLVVACQASTPLTPSPATTSSPALSHPTPVSAPPPTPAEIPSLAPWARANVPAFVDRIRSTAIMAVATRANETVAVGRVAGDAGVWLLTDGSWERVEDADFAGGWLIDIAATQLGFVAVGYAADDGELVLHSTDGRTWEPIEVAAAVEIDAISDIDVGTNGRAWMIAIHAELDQPAVIRTSMDGETWDAGSGPILESVTTITDVEGSWLLAAGGADLFRSRDGRSWTPMPSPPGAAGIADVVRFGERYVAVGTARHGEFGGAAAIWTSDDLERWVPAEVPRGLPTDRDASIGAVAHDGRMLIAVGSDADGGIGVWVSGDGIAWQIQEGPAFDVEVGGAEATSVVAVDGAALVLGTTPLGDPSFRSVATLWATPPPDETLPARWTPEPPPCDRATHDVVDVAALPPSSRLDCFGDRPLRLSGFVIGTDCGDRDWGSPAWLASRCSLALAPVGASLFDVVFLFVHAKPDTGAKRDLNKAAQHGQRVNITGAFDNPAATTCTSTTGEPEADIVARCREAFVVTSVESSDD